MPVRGERQQREPPPADATQRLAVALLSGSLSKRPKSVLIQCDRAADSDVVFQTLRAMRNSYTPPRDR